MESFIKGYVIEVYHEGNLVPGLEKKDFNVVGAEVLQATELTPGKYAIEFRGAPMNVIKGGRLIDKQHVVKMPGKFRQFLKRFFG